MHPHRHLGRRSRGGTNGHPDFGPLKSEIERGNSNRLIYYDFDLLYLDGFGLRDAMLLDRLRGRSPREFRKSTKET